MTETNSSLLHPASRKHRLMFAIFGVFMLGLIAATYFVYREYQRLGKNSALFERVVSSKEAIARIPVNIADADTQKRWDILKAERDFNWDVVFEALEHTAAKDIELLEFEPEKSNRIVILRGEAKDQRALTAFIAALSAEKQLYNVHLLHQQKVSRDRLETMSFEIKAEIAVPR